MQRVKYENVIERIYEPGRLLDAWQKVKRNAGAAGVDEMSVQDFERKKPELMKLIYEKLKSGVYRFKPAQRVLIRKEGSTKPRKLGIPVVMDRVVAVSINEEFGKIFSPEFTESNYGFRRGKSQHQAIRHVQTIVNEGYEWCAAIDLKSFFDKIPHGLILKLIRRKISDERLVTLIARSLKAGVMVNGKFEKTTEGVGQGSPLSPMISNIVLNELDHELERRGLRYCRWADDFVILVKSERAANRVMANVTRYLEEELGLPVNREKSEVALIKDITFLGFKIHRRKIRISEKAREKFKNKVRTITRRNNPHSMYQVIQELNKYLQGWVGYFKIQEFKYPFRDLDAWTRSRLRSTQLKKWKKPQKFQRIMINAGFDPHHAHRTWIRMAKWQSVTRREVRFVMNLEWFRNKGVIFLHDFTQATLKS